MAKEIKPTVVSCKDCGQVLSELSNLPEDKRLQCSTCGSKARHFEVAISESVQTHSQLGIKARHGKTGKPFLEAKSGDDQFRQTGEWMSLERVVDRENDHYKEVITNPRTGEVLRHCEEPLSQHRDRGSAKRKSETAQSNDDA